MSVRRRELLPLEHPNGKTWIMRVEPVEEFIPDLDHPTEMDEFLWLVSEAVGDGPKRQLIGVYRRIATWKSVDPMIAIMWSLWHPQTPFGLGMQPDVPFDDGARMVVVFRGLR